MDIARVLAERPPQYLTARHRWLIDVAENSDTDDCIEWPFRRTGIDWEYGRVTINRKPIQASHVILALTGRPRPDWDGYHGASALHACDSPPCCNPRHLSWGTQQQNIADMVERRRTHHQPRSDLTEQNIVQIRALSRNGWSLRQLSDEYGVSPVAIGQIVRHETWKHVRCPGATIDGDEATGTLVTGCIRCT